MTILPHPALAEFAARLNADTVKDQQKEIGHLNAVIERLRQEIAGLQFIVDSTCEAVIEHKGKQRTLISILEKDEFRPLCVICHDPDCFEHEEVRHG